MTEHDDPRRMHYSWDPEWEVPLGQRAINMVLLVVFLGLIALLFLWAA
jgi:hypothetical protein